MSASEAASVALLLGAYDRLCTVAWLDAARCPARDVGVRQLRGLARVTAAARAALGDRCAAILAAGGTAPAVALARGGFKLVLAAARGGGAASAGALARRDYPAAAPFAAHLAQQCLMFAAVLLSPDGGDGTTLPAMHARNSREFQAALHAWLAAISLSRTDPRREWAARVLPATTPPQPPRPPPPPPAAAATRAGAVRAAVAAVDAARAAAAAAAAA